MKLALIYDRFTRGGGLENYLADFTTALVGSGHEIEVITARTSPETEHIPNRIHLLKRHGFTDGAKMRDFDTSAATVLDSWNDFDVTIGFGRTTTHDLHRAGGGCHAVYSRMLPALKRLRPKNKVELDLERQLYTSGHTRHFVVNSSMVRDQLGEEYGVNQDAITVIHTAVDAARFAPAPNHDTAKSNVCHELGTDPERPAFLFVSLNHRRKGLARILDTWKDLDADLWVLGSPLTSSLRKQIESAGIEDSIHHIPAQDPARYYAAADWFLHPSLYDACANTVLQSLASGLPGIISVQDGAHEFIEDGVNGFLLQNPNDQQSLREQLERAIATSDSDHAFLSQSARHSVLSLTWDRHLSDWQRLISKVA